MLKNISHALGNQLSGAVRQLGRAQEKISTGKRINRAADDAVGLAISNRFQTKALSTERANHNINDAMSAIQLAEAGAAEIYQHILGMKELAIQASNGTYSDEERQHLQEVYQGHQLSIQRISLGSNHQDALTVLNGGWVQLSFAIDVSGSMGGEIANLRNAINGGTSSLASLLENNDIYTQFSLTAVGNREDSDGADTKAILGDPAFTEELDALRAVGQYEDPYAAISSMIGVMGNDLVGFSSLADQRHIVYITDTGREYIADSSVSQNSTLAAIKDNGITFHAIRSGGGASALDTFVDQTSGTKVGLNSDGSNIAAALDDINDIIIENTKDKRPTPIQAGPDVIDQVKLDIPVNMSLNALGLTFTSSDVKTMASANTAIGQLQSALSYYSDRRAFLGGSFKRLEAALEINLSNHAQLKSQASRIEDADMARSVAVSVGMQFRAQTSTEMLQKWFQIKSSTLSRLFDLGGFSRA